MKPKDDTSSAATAMNLPQVGAAPRTAKPLEPDQQITEPLKVALAVASASAPRPPASTAPPTPAPEPRPFLEDDVSTAIHLAQQGPAPAPNPFAGVEHTAAPAPALDGARVVANPFAAVEHTAAPAPAPDGARVVANPFAGVERTGAPSAAPDGARVVVNPLLGAAPAPVSATATSASTLVLSQPVGTPALPSDSFSTRVLDRPVGDTSSTRVLDQPIGAALHHPAPAASPPPPRWRWALAVPLVALAVAGSLWALDRVEVAPAELPPEPPRPTRLTLDAKTHVIVPWSEHVPDLVLDERHKYRLVYLADHEVVREVTASLEEPRAWSARRPLTPQAPITFGATKGLRIHCEPATRFPEGATQPLELVDLATRTRTAITLDPRRHCWKLDAGRRLELGPGVRYRVRVPTTSEVTVGEEVPVRVAWVLESGGPLVTWTTGLLEPGQELLVEGTAATFALYDPWAADNAGALVLELEPLEGALPTSPGAPDAQ